ncbi:MAG TPA: hypothetical protein VIM11_00455 [Tepidisphaeraceae bacterium]|jgi:hypothetical protein
MAERQSTHSLTETEVVDLVRRYLQPHQPNDYRLDVLVDGIKKDDDWWYVLVRPSRDDVPPYDYYSRLAEAEVSMRDEEDLNILLVPVLPE